jgi:hypothetical protein
MGSMALGKLPAIWRCGVWQIGRPLAIYRWTPRKAEMTATTHLFGKLPADVFRLFTGSSRGFFADLLEYLDDEVFGIAGELVSRRAAIDAIGEFIRREAQDLAFEDAEAERLSADERRDADPRKFFAYYRLVDTGWIVEHRDRYRRIVDLDPDARLLLQALLEIKSGRMRSYGGEVLQVQALLESAKLQPRTKSENVANAGRSAKSFRNHLRSVTGAMRKIEDVLVQQTDLKSLFGTYFHDFVAEQLIVDYKRLHTQDNPFRFRVDILDLAQEMASDQNLVDTLAEAMVREGRSGDTAEAAQRIQDDLQAVVSVFQAIDDHLELIYSTQSRIERRVRNTVRYMDRISEIQTDRITTAIELLGRTELPDDAPVSVGHKFTTVRPAICEGNLYMPARKRGEPERRALSRRQKDPALEAFRRDLMAYRERARITPDKLVAYIERALGDRQEIAAEQMPLETLDDFFLFERLRDLPYLADGAFQQRYTLELTGGRLENEWIACPDFVLRRAKQKDEAA